MGTDLSTPLTSKMAQVLTINAPGLDPIDVIFLDHSPGKGRVIIRCYSQAWTAWWGAMGERKNVASFFMSCDAQYLVGNLIHGPRDCMLARKVEKQEAYLVRIVEAVHAALRVEASS
jgi:hypothetical protein